VVSLSPTRPVNPVSPINALTLNTVNNTVNNSLSPVNSLVNSANLLNPVNPIGIVGQGNMRSPLKPITSNTVSSLIHTANPVLNHVNMTNSGLNADIKFAIKTEVKPNLYYDKRDPLHFNMKNHVNLDMVKGHSENGLSGLPLKGIGMYGQGGYPVEIKDIKRNFHPKLSNNILTEGKIQSFESRIRRRRVGKALCFPFAREGKQNGVKKFDRCQICEVIVVSYGIPLTDEEAFLADDDVQNIWKNTPEQRKAYEVVFRFWNSQFGRLTFWPRSPYLERSCGALWIGTSAESVLYADTEEAGIRDGYLIGGQGDTDKPAATPKTHTPRTHNRRSHQT